MPNYSRAATTRFLVCAVATLAVSTSSCSTQGEATPHLPNGSTVAHYPSVVDSVHLRLPVQDYMQSDAALQTISAARTRIMNRCLQRFKVKGTQTPATTGPDPYGPRSLTDRRYGITDLSLAAKFGFGLGPRDPRLRARPVEPSLSPDDRTVFTGEGRSQINGQSVPEGGCLGEAERALDARKPAGADTGLPQNLQFESFEWSQHDPRVLAAFKAWSACMASHKYHYRDPLATPADSRFTTDSRTSTSKLAISTAIADVGCKRKTNLVGIWFGVESEHQKQQIQGQASAFKAAKDALGAREAIARTIPS